MPWFSGGEWKFQRGKDEWKKEKGKRIRKNAPSFLQNLKYFAKQKCFRRFIWLFNAGNKRSLKISALYLLSSMADTKQVGEGLKKKQRNWKKPSNPI